MDNVHHMITDIKYSEYYINQLLWALFVTLLTLIVYVECVAVMSKVTTRCSGTMHNDGGRILFMS